MDMLYATKTDGDTLWSDMKHREKLIKLKRRWLMGLSTSKSKDSSLPIPEFIQENKCLPESLLREDDLLYETVKRCVEEAYGEVCDEHMIHHDNQVLVDLLPNISRAVISRRLDSLNNMGLYHIALMLLAHSDHGFETTRWSMKKMIKESLSKISDKQHREVFKNISHILTDTRFFRQKSAKLFNKAPNPQIAAARKILDVLHNFPLQTLITMKKKIRGKKCYILYLNCKKSGWSRERLICEIREKCEKLLSKLGEGDALQEPLAKAMEVARLSLKLTSGFQTPVGIPEFQQFSPETVTMQNEIAKAIWLIRDNYKVRYPELKNIAVLLDPNFDIPSMVLRSTIDKLLMEYLFECDDMDTIPKSLAETVSMINLSSRNLVHKCFPKEEIEQEVEGILNVSAQIKQIVLDQFPENDYDEDFTCAYMEDLEESEDDDEDDGDLQQLLHDYAQSNKVQCNDSQLESIGETNPINSTHLSNGVLNSSFEPEKDVVMESANSPDPFSSKISGEHENCVPGKERTCKNHYLAMQEVCDNTSMIAYHLIGRMLNEYARIDGLKLDSDDELYLRGNISVPGDSQEEKMDSSMEDVDSLLIIRVVEELIPSFTESGKERLKKLTSLLGAEM